MGRRSETGGVTPKGDRIQVRFSYRGEDLRPTLDMKPTAANLKHAKRIREAIVAEIKAGTFSLAEYFPDYKFAEKFEADERGRTFGQWCAVWQQAAAWSLEHSTLAIYVRHLSCYWLPEFKDDMPQAITHERVVLRLAKLGSGYFDEISGKEVKPLSRKTQNNILIPLRHVFGMVCKACRGVKDPTEGVDNLKVQVGDPDPFSAAEVAKILPALAEDFGEAVHDYFEFAIFAGLRSSEQIALVPDDVNLQTGIVRVCRTRVLGKDKDRTKTVTAREVELNGRALAAITRQLARAEAAKSPTVFFSPRTGQPWHDEQVPRRIWVKALAKAGVRYRPPKECRDTSVTLALVSGADPLWVALQHGHSLEVMLESYAKYIPKADLGRNLAAVNRGITASNSALEPHQKSD